MEDSQIGGFQKAITIVLWCTALSLNFSNTILLWRATRKRSSWANVLLLLLAVVDLLCLIMVVVPMMLAAFMPSLLLSHSPLCHVQGFTLNTFILLSYGIIGYISVDQFLAVCHPFMYSTRIVRFPKRSLKILAALLLGLLLVSLIMSALPLMLRSTLTPLNPPVMCLFNLAARSYRAHMIGWTNVIAMLALSVTLAYCTCCVGLGLYKSVRRSLENLGGVRQNRQQGNFAKLSMVIAIVLLACFLPFTIVSLLQLVNLSQDKTLVYITINILLLNTLLNPVLYVLSRASVREQYLGCCRRIIEQCIRKTNGMAGRPTPGNRHRVNIEPVTPAPVAAAHCKPHTSTPSVPLKTTKFASFAKSQGSISTISWPPPSQVAHCDAGIELKSFSMDCETLSGGQACVSQFQFEATHPIDGHAVSLRPNMPCTNVFVDEDNCAAPPSTYESK